MNSYQRPRVLVISAAMTDLPAPFAGGARAIKNHPREIEWTRLRSGCDFHGTETLRTPIAQLRQRHAVGHPAAKIRNAIRRRSGRYLLLQERNKIARMQTIAQLIAASFKSDVFERPPLRPRMDPEAEDPLVGAAELAGAGHHSAAVDPHWKIKRLSIFERESFRSQVC